jgi:hypothetical protein
VKFYEFVQTDGLISWDDAKVAAEGTTKYGLTGYLATITSEHENTYIKNRMGEADGWIGASDNDEEGNWKWVTGPDAGISFWSGLAAVPAPDADPGTIPGTPVGNAYSHWNSGEPNNSGGMENCAQFYTHDEARGFWNDGRCDFSVLPGYIVEYGEDGNAAEVVNKSIPITVTAANINIANCDELMAVDDIDSNRFQNIILTADINCTGKTVNPLFTGFDFEGVFDGKNHKITGYQQTQTDPSFCSGVFSRSVKATLKNVYLENGFLHSDYECVGALIGRAQNTTIENVHSNWEIKGGGVTGGLVGSFSASMFGTSIMRNSSSSANVISTGSDVGGLIGHMGSLNGYGIIEQSYATGNVSSSQSVSNYGGLIGNATTNITSFTASTILIQNTYATGTITGASITNAGGLIGRVSDFANNSNNPNTTIKNSYATGNVTALNNGGGVLGIVDSFQLKPRYAFENLFATGLLTITDPENTGGIIGLMKNPYVVSTNNFYDATQTGASSCAGSGLTGEPLSNCTAIDTSTNLGYFKNNQIKQPMASWNFSTIWKTNAGDYPTFGINEDNDGVSATLENAGPNNGDANNDGVLDSSQSNVASFMNTNSNTYTTFEVPYSCAIHTIANQTTSQFLKQDTGFTYPFGMIDFTVKCINDGLSVPITEFYFKDNNSSDFVFRKYHPTTNTYTAMSDVALTDFTLGSNKGIKVVFQITDGGLLDDDGTANGEISDPSGLALVVNPGVPNTGLERINILQYILISFSGLILIALIVSKKIGYNFPWEK